MNISTDTIGNRTRDIPACSTVPQPTALRDPLKSDFDENRGFMILRNVIPLLRVEIIYVESSQNTTVCTKKEYTN